MTYGFFKKVNEGQSDLIGLMIDASAGKHAGDQTAELMTDILDDEVSHNANSASSDTKKALENVKHKTGKYLLSGLTLVVKTNSPPSCRCLKVNCGNLKRCNLPMLTADDQIVDNCILFLMAGFDSTSNTLAFALHLLAKEPEIQERAYEEITQQIGDLVF